MTAPHPRPRVVTAAFWCWVAASILLIVGGLMAATVNIPVAYRGAGVITALAGAGLAYAAGRTRNGDSRFRRAAIALSMTIVVLTSILAVAAQMLGGAVATLTVLAVIPLIAGTVLMARPAAASWAEQDSQ
jgi:CDP-diglyceride synthetase